ncbi:MAG: hypothetical protein IJP61_04105 [Treponema sp.]|nr:hypothetical protein [Treponema sp.]
MEKVITDDIRNQILESLRGAAEKMLEVEYNRDEYNKLFPRGYIRTPIGVVKLSPHQFERLGDKDDGKRTWLLGALYQTLKEPLVIIKDTDAKGRDSKLFIKLLEDKDSKKRLMVSVVPTIDGIEVVVSSGLRKEKQIVAKIKSASSFYYKAEGGGHTTGTD